MFTGIIEQMGIVKRIIHEETNIHFWVASPLTNELKIDQSLSHNGVCLTIVELGDDQYRVTAVLETLEITNLGKLNVGDKVNLERSMLMNGRLDGHIVQGHIDQIGICTDIVNENGSWEMSFKYKNSKDITVEKGSICVNGVSLTVFNSKPHSFSVAVIPYTFHHTNFSTLKKGDSVNLEFDIIGKYLAKFHH